MSIVSKYLNINDVGYNHSYSGSIKNNIRYGHPVGFNKGDPVFPEYQQQTQLPNFNVSKNISKPYIPAPYIHNPIGNVPLKCNQEGTHAGAMLFFGDQPTQVEPLKVPYYEGTNMYQNQAEEYTPSFNPPYQYNEGIRPSIRALHEIPILEPAAPMFRPKYQKNVHYRDIPFGVHYLPEQEIVKEVRGL